MSDGERRDLERAAAAGDLGAEAQLLIERWRTGDLSEERLRFAAYLGHEPARRAGPDVGRPDDPKLWFERLDRYSLDVQLRVARVVVRSEVERQAPYPDHYGAWRQVSDAFSAWIDERNSVTEAALLAAAEAHGMGLNVSPTWDAHHELWELATVPEKLAEEGLGEVDADTNYLRKYFGDDALLRERVEAELLPWALS